MKIDGLKSMSIVKGLNIGKGWPGESRTTISLNRIMRNKK